jgi:hypothetical protein
MTSKRTFSIVVLAGLLVGACGNYSNDDLDFQLALPEASDMAAQMQLSVVRLNSAEYYRATRTAITTFNGMVESLAGLIDLVRGITPTTRNGNERVWGPWPADKVPGWELRVVMQRTAVSASMLHMDYWVQVRPVGTGDSGWVSFLVGQYTSAGAARVGQGEIALRADYVRAARYPIDTDAGLVNLEYLIVTYDNAAFPIHVTMDIANRDSTTGQYESFQNQDGSGQMSFDWQGKAEATGADVSARMQAEWIGSGAGRADLTAVLASDQPTVVTTLGIDCWGVDSVATYSYRLADGSVSGDPGSCLF